MWVIEYDGRYLVRMDGKGQPVWCADVAGASMMRQWQAEAQAGHLRVHFGIDAVAVATHRVQVVEVV